MNDSTKACAAAQDVAMNDLHHLQRFVLAQDPIYPEICAELAAGAKASHWMWFVFPQLKALGRSSTAQFFGIASRDEALAYWRHPVLGPRLKASSELVMAVQGKTALQIFHSPDDLKFCSSMTLFAQVAPQDPVFDRALDKYCGGKGDAATLELLDNL